MKSIISLLLIVWIFIASTSGLPFRICPGNLQYQIFGSACSCEDDPIKIEFCPVEIGFPRCRCPLGTVRFGHDRCVLPHKCPKNKCPGDLEYTECSSICPRTCQTRDMVCAQVCGPPQCQCPSGTVLFGNNQCIEPEQCPSHTTTIAPPMKCIGDLVFSQCGRMCTFTCESKTRICTLGCAKPRCQCPAGTVLVGKDKCIPPEQCPATAQTTTLASPKKCSGDLIYRECGSMCTFTCASQHMLCPQACAEPRCQCPGGTVLVGEDKCIRPEECATKTTTTAPPQSIICSGDLVYRHCGSMCTFTCDTKVMLCPLGCALPRCQCPAGTVLVGKDKCIKPEDCQKGNTTESVPWTSL